MTGLGIALTMFSVLPGRTGAGALDRRGTGAVLRWLPVVGLLLGGLAGTLGSLASYRQPTSPLLCAAIAVAVLVALTGALHLDGLADTADGLGSRAAPARALEIMRRGDIGPFGAASLILVLLLDVSALTAMHGNHWRLAAAVTVAATTGRVAAMQAALPGIPPARDGGFGSLVAGTVSRRAAVIGTLLVMLLAALLDSSTAAHRAPGISGAIGWPVAVAVALAVGWWLRGRVTNRLGGVTGDVFGALIEFTTMLTLLGAALS